MDREIIWKCNICNESIFTLEIFIAVTSSSEILFEMGTVILIHKEFQMFTVYLNL